MREHRQSRTGRADSEALRIGFFSESFQPVQNGVTTSMLTLMRELRAQHHHVVVFAPANQQQRDPETNVLRFPSFVSVFNREYPLAYPFVPRLSLAPYFKGIKLDVVHTHTPFILGLTGANLALSHQVPLVTSFHTLYSQYSHYMPFLPESVTNGLLEVYLPWYYNRCAEIICPSELAARTLRAMGVERPIEAIPTGVPLPPPAAISEDSRQCVRQRWNLAASAPLLVYAGRLAKEKNLDWLLEVFVRVCRQVPTAHLVIAGGGPYAEELQAFADTLEAREAITFLGPTPRAELDPLYAAADVFCFPSPTETQGLVIGEARAAGAPCVVINAGGAPETVRDGEDGFRIQPGDQEGFADRVVRIVQDASLRARLRENALRNARNFTPETMAYRVRAIYERARRYPPAAPPSQEISRAGEETWATIQDELAGNTDASGQK